MSDETTQQTTPPAARVLEVPIGEDGKIGTLPDPLQKLVDARIREATQRVAAKRTPDPVEAETLRTLQAEVEQYRIKDAEAGKRYEEAIAIREAREQAERQKLQAEIDRRTERLKRAVQADIKAEALKAGAREESLDELAAILGPRVGLNDDLDPVVDGADSIEALVSAYLDSKPHHRKSPGGKSMGTTGGGARQTGADAGTQAQRDAILARIAKRGVPTGEDFKELAALRAGGRG